jgi:hypothetical protein
MKGINHEMTVEAAVIHEDGALTLVPADVEGIAYVDLAAEISPTIFDKSDFVIETVYMANQFTGEFEYLTGDIGRCAKVILMNDARWLEWARDRVLEGAA